MPLCWTIEIYMLKNWNHTALFIKIIFELKNITATCTVPVLIEYDTAHIVIKAGGSIADEVRNSR